MARLILVRHGKSEWNEKGLWTSLTDVDLIEEGVLEARRAGAAISEVPVHRAHTSMLKRAQQTLHHIEEVLGHVLEITIHPALNERNYGIYTGKNKWQVKEEIGEAEFLKLRRGWDVHIPEGESLKDVYARVAPYYETVILDDIKNGSNTLVVAHGNSLRALVKRVENIPDENISDIEIGTGEVYMYDFDSTGNVLSKEIRAINPNKSSI